MSYVRAVGFSGDQGVGVWNLHSSPIMAHVTSLGLVGDILNMGMLNEYSSPQISDSTVVADMGVINIGMLNDTSSPVLRRVSVTARGGSASNAGFKNVDSAPVLIKVVARGIGGNTAYGMYNESSAPLIASSMISGTLGWGSSYGIFNTAAAGSYTIHVDDSQLFGVTAAVKNADAFTVLIGMSRVDGDVLGTGTVRCAGTYDGNYVFVQGPACP